MQGKNISSRGKNWFSLAKLHLSLLYIGQVDKVYSLNTVTARKKKQTLEIRQCAILSVSGRRRLSVIAVYLLTGSRYSPLMKLSAS